MQWTSSGVLDDEKAIRRSIKEILEFEKYEVDEAEDGAQGFSMAQKNNYDIILSDIKMPKMHGFELYREIRKVDGQVKIP